MSKMDSRFGYCKAHQQYCDKHGWAFGLREECKGCVRDQIIEGEREAEQRAAEAQAEEERCIAQEKREKDIRAKEQAILDKYPVWQEGDDDEEEE